MSKVTDYVGKYGELKVLEKAMEGNRENKIARGKFHHSSNRELFIDSFIKYNLKVPESPVFIATSVDAGTPRARANHLDAVIDYCEEQERLKKNNEPIV